VSDSLVAKTKCESKPLQEQQRGGKLKQGRMLIGIWLSEEEINRRYQMPGLK